MAPQHFQLAFSVPVNSSFALQWSKTDLILSNVPPSTFLWIMSWFKRVFNRANWLSHWFFPWFTPKKFQAIGRPSSVAIWFILHVTVALRNSFTLPSDQIWTVLICVAFLTFSITLFNSWIASSAFFFNRLFHNRKIAFQTLPSGIHEMGDNTQNTNLTLLVLS